MLTRYNERPHIGHAVDQWNDTGGERPRRRLSQIGRYRIRGYGGARPLPHLADWSCSGLVDTFGLSSAPGASAADLRVPGQLALSFGSGDWSVGVRADADARERRTDRVENSPRPAVEPTTRFSGTGGRFESLCFNGLPVVSQ